MEESSGLTKGIKGITIGKQPNEPVTSMIDDAVNATKSRLPRLYISDHGRRKATKI